MMVVRKKTNFIKAKERSARLRFENMTIRFKLSSHIKRNMHLERELSEKGHQAKILKQQRDEFKQAMLAVYERVKGKINRWSSLIPPGKCSYQNFWRFEKEKPIDLRPFVENNLHEEITEFVTDSLFQLKCFMQEYPENRDIGIHFILNHGDDHNVIERCNATVSSHVRFSREAIDDWGLDQYAKVVALNATKSFIGKIEREYGRN